jgi:hypothetical protein
MYQFLKNFTNFIAISNETEYFISEIIFRRLIMPDDKARDDKYINKNESYEVKFILAQYAQKDWPEVKQAIMDTDYQTHDELYKRLARKGIKRK